MAKKEKPQITSEFFAGVLALLPEEVRTGAQATFEAISKVDAARDHVADRTLAKDEFSRSMDETRTTLEEGRAALVTKEKTLDEATASMNTEREAAWKWHEDHKTVFADPGVKAAVDAVTAGKPLAPGAKPSAAELDPSKFITPEQQTEALGKFANEALGAINQIQDARERHFDDFGERLTSVEIAALTTHPEVARLGVLAVHQLINQKRYAEKATATQTKHDEELIEQGRLKGVEEASKHAGPGYPLAGQQVDSSTVDAFVVTDEQQKALDEASDPAAMAAEYTKKVAEAPPEAFV